MGLFEALSERAPPEVYGELNPTGSVSWTLWTNVEIGSYPIHLRAKDGHQAFFDLVRELYEYYH